MMGAPHLLVSEHPQGSIEGGFIQCQVQAPVNPVPASRIYTFFFFSF